MTYAAALDANQHFAAFRFGTIDDGFAQRSLIGGEREAAELCHESILAASKARASPTTYSLRKDRADGISNRAVCRA